MPLSKEHQAEYMRQHRAELKDSVIPKSDSVIPKPDELQPKVTYNLRNIRPMPDDMSKYFAGYHRARHRNRQA